MNKKLGLNFLLPIIQYFKKYKNVLWLFGGDGPLKEDFIYSTRDILNIKFMSFQKSSELSEWLNTGDIHIIPQDEEVEELLLPSKLITILASGNPIVSNVNRKTEVGKIVDKAGIRVDPKDQLGFINALDYLIKNEKLRLFLGEKGHEIVKNQFSKKVVLRNFEKFINKFMESE